MNLFFLFFLFLSFLAIQALLPSPTVPDNLGVNIHFISPKTGELEELADTGWGFIRMDFFWQAIEREKGKYDFSGYDGLVSKLAAQNVRPLFILDYGNPLYDKGLSPYTDEGRAAFAAFALAGVEHFAGKGVVWEMWNEPNIGFWQPKPNVSDYVKLALTVGKAIKPKFPKETFIGPTTSTIDLKFIEACLQGGVLEYFDAISVHPYRQNNPESVTSEWDALKTLIAKYKPEGKDVPVISSEWGYSTLYRNNSLEVQGKYIPRELLSNLANHVALSILYDWHNGCTKPDDFECHFGTVYFEYNASSNPVYAKKPSYHSAQTLMKTLKGYTFTKSHIPFTDTGNYILQFDNSAGIALVAWTSGANTTTTIFFPSNRCFRTVTYLGEQGPQICPTNSMFKIPLTDSPLYLLVEH